MSDIIRREQAIKAMQESEFGYTFEVDKAIEAVRALPTVEPEGSEDLISRKEIIRAVDSLGECYISYDKLLLLILKMPSAGLEKKKGKWIYDTERVRTYRQYHCSVCNTQHIGKVNFCPNCGTKMEETK